MDILRTTTCSLLAAFAITGCVQQEEAVTENPFGVGDPPAEALAIIPPADMQEEASSPLTVLNLGQATATGGDGTYAFSHDGPQGGFPLGAAMVNWTVTDGTGAQDTGMQAVLVSDTTAPTLTAPPDIQTLSTGATTMVDIGTATLSDLVDPNPALTNDSPANGFPMGTTGVTWTATDASGNVSMAMQMITIAMADPGALALTAPGPITMEATGPATAVMLGAAMASGGEPPITITNDAPAGGFPLGATTVTWTAVDAAMISATAAQVVTITDTTAPSITAPADVTADQDAGGGNTVVNLGAPAFSDLVDPNPMVSNDAPANGFPVGTTTVVWTAMDASTNSANDVQFVTINPLTAELCSAMVAEFVNTIYPMMDSASPLRCNGCHTGPAPLPTANGWGFPTDPPDADDFELFRTIASIDSGGQSLILAKSTASVAHVGGDRWPNRPNDPDYDEFEDFVNRATVCEPDPPTNTATIDLGSGYEQLHKIAAALGARTPSTDEINTINAANNDQQAVYAALDPIMDGLMNEDAFYVRVQELYNDLLLTDRDANDRGNVDDNFDLDAFANRDYYEGFSGDERNNLREDANYGFARAPLELIKYVIQNNRPFTEVVSADYTMINPYSAVIYGNDAGDPSFPFSSDQNRANHDRDDFRPVNNIRQQDGTPVPAAGVMGTHAFLARYPSTNTNVNRARARYVFDYFLGLDIESLASRDGLDLSNVIGSVPTYEDPQCTVCHNTMDPVAGLFTNRDNDGEYDRGNTFQHNRTMNGVPRMVPAGYTLDPADELPNAQEDTALQWLGSRIAQDDRFAERTVRTVFEGLTGIDATAASTTAFINETKNRFVAANHNFKLLVKDIIASDYFLARNLAVGENPNA
ncbi:MAG: HYR domain-containing protein, partial [Gammaproteobacteria bacterium]|nr:HYR domain-containing protein [Gammaproteobacteria bacterium]